MLMRFPVRYSPAILLASCGSKTRRSCSARSLDKPAVSASHLPHTCAPFFCFCLFYPYIKMPACAEVMPKYAVWFAFHAVGQGQGKDMNAEHTAMFAMLMLVKQI